MTHRNTTPFAALRFAAALAAATFAAGVLAENAPVAIAIHGGAGTLSREEMSPEREAAYRQKLTEAVRAGHAVLVAGGASLDAVTTAIRILEDSPLFNAGRGAVFNAMGQNELDASIMDGATLDAGAVAAVQRIANPIDLARRVMTDSKHVMLIGEGAEEFAREQGFAFVDAAYFYTERRWRQLQEARQRETAGVVDDASWYSTGGAVALDSDGNLAAGTSTGGMTNKRHGRVGDSPIIGAGTYADNDSCAVSATGHGEYFIRHVAAYRICSLIADGATAAEAGRSVIHGRLAAAGGDGGVIILDGDGNIAMPFNTSGMYRASIDTAGALHVAIFPDAR